MKTTTTFLLAALALTTLPALADDDCKVPLERWQPREVVQQMATSQGWTVQRLKIDDGCYELRAQDAQGQRIKVKLNPESLRVIKLKIQHAEHVSQAPDAPMQPVVHAANVGEPGHGWQYFSDPARVRAVVISPDGQYYLSRGKGLRWVAGAPI